MLEPTFGDQSGGLVVSCPKPCNDRLVDGHSVAVKDGRARFERLFRANYDAVLLYALRRIDSAAAADVVSDVFLVLWRRIDDVPDPALPWLYGVARRALANTRRSHARQQALTTRLRHDSARKQIDVGGDSDQDLAAAMASLSADDQELLRLIAWEELEPQQAAEALGISAGTLRVRLHRARNRLTKALEQSATHVACTPIDEAT